MSHKHKFPGLGNAARRHGDLPEEWRMTKGEESLDGIEIFQTMAVADRVATAKRCRWRQFAPDQQIISHMDETRDVFFITAGRVRATSFALTGKEVTYRHIDAGDMFGEFAAIDGEPRSAGVVALTDCVVATMSDAEFWEVLGQHPEVAAATLKRLTSQIRVLTERVFEFSVLAVRNRIHAELLRLARSHDNRDNTTLIEPAPTHAELANHLSTHREAVTRELNALARSGLVERRGHALRINDVAKLSRMVQAILGDQL